MLLSLGLAAPVAGAQTGFVLANLNTPGEKNYYLEKLNTLDHKVLSFLERQRNQGTGLLESFHGSSNYYYDEASQQYYAQKAGLLDQQAFTYDLALAVIVYVINGQNKKADDILAVLKDNFFVEKNGYIGLLNAYQTSEFDVWGQDNLLMGVDGDRIHVGPNMWVAMASLQYDRLSHTAKYLDFAIAIAKWAYGLPHFRFADGSRGAVSMGSGWGPDWSTVYSTENIIDNYAVLQMLEELYKTADEQEKSIFAANKFGLKEIQYEKQCIKNWLLRVGFNKNYQSFNCGYNEKGVDQTKALDTVSWSITALGPEVLVSWGLNPVKMIQFAEENFLVQQEINGEMIEGFDFTDEQGKDKNRPRLIWWEGTGEMVLAYQVMADYSQRQGNPARAEAYQEKALRFLMAMERMNEQAGLPEGVLPYTSIQPKDREVLNTFFYEWEIPRGRGGRWVSALSSTLWRILGMTGFNPLVHEQRTAGLLKHTSEEMRAKANKLNP